jgi:hypothetical protein
VLLLAAACPAWPEDHAARIGRITEFALRAVDYPAGGIAAETVQQTGKGRELDHGGSAAGTVRQVGQEVLALPR